MPRDNRNLVEACVGDGRPLLLLSGLLLFLSGSFAVFQAGTGHFLPHDEAYLGMTVEELCTYHECRIVQFMIHDRIAFGGALSGVGLLYMWLSEFPLRQKRGWGWWAYSLSSVAGFLSFLTFLGYGYLDTWHGIATLLLLPCVVVGLVRTNQIKQTFSLRRWNRNSWSLQQGKRLQWIGNLCLAMTAFGLLSAGAVIMIGGMTRVFVPEDLQYMQLTVEDLNAINPRLVPLIAHDRAAFGGALFSTGIVIAFSILYAEHSRNLWEILLLSGSLGFVSAIGVHFYVGYMNWIHLLPAYGAAIVFYTGIALTYRQMVVNSSFAPDKQSLDVRLNT